MKQWLSKIGTAGLKLPLAWTPSGGSARLLFSHLSFYLALFLVAADKPQAWTSIAFFSICTILQMFKDIDKLKLSAAERSLEIEDTHEQK